MNGNLTISPSQNALDSLRRMADEIISAQAGDSLALKGALTWGWHAVDLLAYLRLQPHREHFDAWMQDFLHEGETALHIERDAHWDEKKHLSLLELLDIFSEETLPMLKPEFYQGWQERRTRCQNLRNRTKALIGGSVSEPQREQLLLLLAVYNRVLHLPACVAIDAGKVMPALVALLDLIEMLIDKNKPESKPLLDVLRQCRRKLEKS